MNQEERKSCYPRALKLKRISFFISQVTFSLPLIHNVIHQRSSDHEQEHNEAEDNLVFHLFFFVMTPSSKLNNANIWCHIANVIDPEEVNEWGPWCFLSMICLVNLHLNSWSFIRIFNDSRTWKKWLDFSGWDWIFKGFYF